MFRTAPRRLILGVVVLLVAAGVGGYFLLSGRTLDGTAAVDAALPVEQDLPGFIPFNGLAGTLSVPPANDSGRSVLTDAQREEQCRTWQNENDGWACRKLRGMGMVVLEQSENVFFRACSYLLAYDDGGAAEDAWRAMADDVRRDTPDAEEKPLDIGDDGVTFTLSGATLLVFRVESVAVQAIVWNGDGHASENEMRDMIAKWPELQARKIDAALG